VKILFIQNRLLFPADTGGKIRTLNVLQHLARWHEVTYLCSADPGSAADAERTRGLGMAVEAVGRRPVRRGGARFWWAVARNLASSWPVSVSKNYDPALRRRAEQLAARQRFDLLVCDFVQTTPYGRGLPVPARVLFQHNVEAQILRRHAEVDRGRLRRRYMRLQWGRMRRFEHEAGEAFDAVIAVSPQDQQTFQSEYGWQHVRRIDTAVDLDYFRPDPAAQRPGECVFVGSLDWMPNADGIARFVDETWPLVRQAVPQARLAVVGRNPPRSVLRLSERPGVEIVGTVPDVRPYLARAAVVIVPLHVGGGTRLKVFSAMAMGKAIVSTALGAEGLGVTDGRDLLIADDPRQFAAGVERLLNDPELRARIGGNARAFVTQRFGSEVVARQFERICLDVVEAARRRPGGGPVRQALPAGRRTDLTEALT
jgi:glycosyltransferase involved in cell wall biosynthesis